MTKQPEETRQQLLEAAFWEIYRRGFQAASIDQILRGTGLTKGALYHHFPNKQALGYAVVDESLRAWLQKHWLSPMEGAEDPLLGIEAAIEGALAEMTDEMLALGCPINNLAQEMSQVDEGFRRRLELLLRMWRGAIAAGLEEGQKQGQVRPMIDPQATAAFLVAAIEGILGAAKNASSRDAARTMIDVLLDFIDGLRPERDPVAVRRSA